MTPYANYGGDSNVVAYDIGVGSLTVEFRDGSVYRYTERSAGAGNLKMAVALAQAGQGLNEFLNRYVKRGYESSTYRTRS